MKCLIYAYDTMYGGLHGMYDWTIEDVEPSEAEDIGYQMSIDVIESYSYTHDMPEDCDSEEYDEWLDSMIAYEIYPIKEEYQNQILEIEENSDIEEIINRYCCH